MRDSGFGIEGLGIRDKGFRDSIHDGVCSRLRCCRAAAGARPYQSEQRDSHDSWDRDGGGHGPADSARQRQIEQPDVGRLDCHHERRRALRAFVSSSSRYVMTATKAGFVTMALGQKDPAATARPSFELREGETRSDAHLSLPRGGVVSGRVVDEFGDPVVDAAAHAFRSEYMQGVRRL
jgi:hypothetical protein